MTGNASFCLVEYRDELLNHAALSRDSDCAKNRRVMFKARRSPQRFHGTLFQFFDVTFPRGDGRPSDRHQTAFPESLARYLRHALQQEMCRAYVPGFLWLSWASSLLA